MNRCGVCELALVAALTVSVGAAEPVFWERDGIVVFEAESCPASGAWSVDREVAGFTGQAYYRWGGPNNMRNAGGGVLSYRIRIVTPGTYHLRIRNYHDHEDSTLENDCFTRMDGGEWVKTFSSKRAEWTWRSNHEFNHGSKPPAKYDLSAGEHLFEISGRSHGFAIDRIHLYRDGLKGEDETLAETRAGPAMPELGAAPRVAKAWFAGALGQALKSAEKLAEGDDEAAGQAKLAASTLRDYAAEQRERIEGFKATAPADAVAALAELSKAYAGHDLGKVYMAEAKDWAKEPAVKDALAADKILAAMRAAQAKLDKHGDATDPQWLKRNKKSLQAIVGGWQQIAKRYPDTPALAQAESMIDAPGLRELAGK
ncbi:MAG: hypothetical protein PF961_05725 [Planctomycetota bacterium]|jgi:GNAT superfamily N-acetyltransferase|nr:hypothetical protein [Planctomycetota bacterium]